MQTRNRLLHKTGEFTDYRLRPGRKDNNARFSLIQGVTETENDLWRKTVKSHPSLLSAGK